MLSYQCDFPDLGGCNLVVQDNGLFEGNIQNQHSDGHHVDHYFKIVQGIKFFVLSLYLFCV